MLGEAEEAGVVGLGVDGADISGGAAGAVGVGGVPEVVNQGAGLRGREGALVHAPGDSESDEEDGVAEQVFIALALVRSVRVRRS